MKKALSVLLVLLMSFSLFAAGIRESAPAEEAAPTTKVFTDSLGREVTVPAEITRVAPSGNMAQLGLYTTCPELMVGKSGRIEDRQAPYILDYIEDLPVFGAFYGKKANLNKEAVLEAAPEIVIDIGEIKGSKEDMAKDLDVLSEQLGGMPVVFIENYLENTGKTYDDLGELLNMKEVTDKLSDYADEAIRNANEKSAAITDPVTVFYTASPDGLVAYPTGNFHTQVFDITGCKNVVPKGFSRKESPISLEQLFLWDPDVIFVTTDSAYETATTDAKWEGLSAVQNGRVYKIPSLPYNFVDGPPSVNRLVGIYYVGSMVYPELWSDIDLREKVIEYYDLFYHYDLSDAEAAELLGL